MGTLITMAYPTTLFAKQADHTYVKCDTGRKAWSCWGGKSGGRELRRGTGATKRADKIAQPDEKAGIKCYLINGVCHQAANRILLPAGIIVRGARGYSISEALFGTYGRVGSWPCNSPFNQYPSETGDLPECIGASLKKTSGQAAEPQVRTVADKLDWQYITGVLKIYAQAQTLMKTRSIVPDEALSFHLRLFMYMAEFNLGPMLDKTLASKLKQVRSRIEKVRVKAETAFTSEKMKAREFVDAINKATIDFQDEIASFMKPSQYETLFDLKPGDHVILADQNIVTKVFDLK
jgi:hypothetical protein